MPKEFLFPATLNKNKQKTKQKPHAQKKKKNCQEDKRT